MMVFVLKLVAASRSLSTLSVSNSLNKSPRSIPIVERVEAVSSDIHFFAEFSGVFLCHSPSKYSCFSPSLKSIKPSFFSRKGLFAKIQESLETLPETTASPSP